jgi:hypothetical protein
MTLADIVPRLPELPRDGIICAKRPWHSGSDCVVAEPTPELGVPADAKAQGLDYFLEVHVALEVLEAIGDKKGRELDLLLHYAEYDGFPEWLYD